MAVTQSHFRFGINELAESTHGWHANEDTNPSQGVLGLDTTFLLRFTLQCDGTAQSNIDPEFQYRRNGGTWTNINTTSTVVRAVTTTVFTNGQNTTKRLSGTGTFESSSAGCTHDGVSGGTAFDIVASGNGETECSMQIRSADVVGGDVIEFRLTRDGGTLLDTYSVTPSYTLALTATRGRVSAVEFEVPAVATRGRISAIELEVPFVATRGRISTLEFEVPLTSTRGRISDLEFEVPSAAANPTRGLISALEFEVPDLPIATRGRIGNLELEVPFLPTRGRISAIEFEVPDVGAGSYIPWCAITGISGYSSAEIDDVFR